MDFKKEIILANGIEKKYIAFSRQINELAFLILSLFSEKSFVMPSSGFLTLIYVMFCRRFMNSEIILIGFEFSGWEGHPWLAERKIIEKFASQNLITKL